VERHVRADCDDAVPLRIRIRVVEPVVDVVDEDVCGQQGNAPERADPDGDDDGEGEPARANKREHNPPGA
jgi:hypothetical protein